ncbi:hypothetical protein NL676_010869 [Syzygium grande]|nr:hypothetical protein NL676_010869 [Syzygium grande]
MGRLKNSMDSRICCQKLLDLLTPKDATFLLLLESSYNVIDYILKRRVGSCPDVDFGTCWVSQHEMLGDSLSDRVRRVGCGDGCGGEETEHDDSEVQEKSMANTAEMSKVKAKEFDERMRCKYGPG